MLFQLTSPQEVFFVCFETAHTSKTHLCYLNQAQPPTMCQGRTGLYPFIHLQVLQILQHFWSHSRWKLPAPQQLCTDLIFRFSHTDLNLPCPSLLSLLFFSNAESSNPLAQLAPRYQIPTEEFWARSFTEQTGLPLSLNVSPSLSPSLSVAGNPPLSSVTGMIFLNCVYLLAPWCESVSHQLHINLVSSLWTFSSLP